MPPARVNFSDFFSCQGYTFWEFFSAQGYAFGDFGWRRFGQILEIPGKEPKKWAISVWKMPTHGVEFSIAMGIIFINICLANDPLLKFWAG